MRVESAELYFLKIPLRLSVTHGARAARTSSDSIVLALAGDGGKTGYGEAVLREYVSGVLAEGSGLPREAASLVGRLISTFRGRDVSWGEVQATLRDPPCRPQELPFLCAVETALLDLACAEAGADAYDVLGAAPLRDTVTYGGVIPMVPLDQAGAYVERYRGFGFRDAKVKVGGDPAYNDSLLALCRARLGQEFAIRVDANASWTEEAAPELLAICARHGVRMVEQPFPAAVPHRVLAEARARGFEFIADEGIVTAGDVRSVAEAGGFGVLNLRLAKNGGLTRVLSLAAAAEARGLRYQLGCMVGETAILSALGRVAASLLPSPLFVEGSYDDIILTENVTAKGIGFGPGGVGTIIRGNGIGARVQPEKLAALAVDRRAC
jgi:L-alanine-DL-glutamate epimerase-like enolase superfamily enzyme